MKKIIEEMIEEKFKGEDNLVIVRSPDHPFLVLTPNILVGRFGQLMAIFIPYKNEIKSPDKLLVRLALTKLALPSHLKTVLIANSWNNKIERQFEDNFDVVIHESDKNIMGSLINIIDSNMDKSNSQLILNKIQRKIHLRMDLFSKYSMQKTKPHKDARVNQKSFEMIKNESQKVLIPSWTDHNKMSLSRSLFDYHGTIITSSNFENGKNIYNTLAKIIFLSTKIHFQFDNGIPYLIQNTISPNIVLVNKIPMGYFDPLKPIRAAAFGGWVYMNPGEPSEIGEIQDRILKLKKRGVLE